MWLVAWGTIAYIQYFPSSSPLFNKTMNSPSQYLCSLCWRPVIWHQGYPLFLLSLDLKNSFPLWCFLLLDSDSCSTHGPFLSRPTTAQPTIRWRLERYGFIWAFRHYRINSQIEDIDSRFPDSSAPLFLQEIPDTTSVSEGVVSRMAYLSSTKGSQLFTTGSLGKASSRSSRKSSMYLMRQQWTEWGNEETSLKSFWSLRIYIYLSWRPCYMLNVIHIAPDLYSISWRRMYTSELSTTMYDVYPFTERKASFIRTISGIWTFMSICIKLFKTSSRTHSIQNKNCGISRSSLHLLIHRILSLLR